MQAPDATPFRLPAHAARQRNFPLTRPSLRVMRRIKFINSRSAAISAILWAQPVHSLAASTFLSKKSARCDGAPRSGHSSPMIAAVIVLALLAALVATDGGSDANHPPRT